MHVSVCGSSVCVSGGWGAITPIMEKRRSPGLKYRALWCILYYTSAVLKEKNCQRNCERTRKQKFIIKTIRRHDHASHLSSDKMFGCVHYISDQMLHA